VSVSKVIILNEIGQIILISCTHDILQYENAFYLFHASILNDNYNKEFSVFSGGDTLVVSIAEYI
jgi:hypothetical protein